MPTPTILKAQIDSQITNKTLPYSIDNVEVGNTLKDIVDLASGIISFNTTAERIAYLSGGLSAAGQMGLDLEENSPLGNLYYIAKNNTWQLFVTQTTAKVEVVLFSAQSVLTVAWNSERKLRFGVAAQFIVETIDEDGQYRQKPNLEIKPDSVSDTTQYTIDLGGSNQTGRLVIK